MCRIGGIEYLFKYVCKDSERVAGETISYGERYNEIGHFHDVRYLSASESVRRSVAFDIVDRSPIVVRVDVHLVDQQRAVLAEGQK